MVAAIDETYRCILTLLLPVFANPKGNASNGSSVISARTCYMLHGILVIIHIVLVISYIFHWEHHVTLLFTTTNDNFWSVVLSASLQAFYTVRVLLYHVSDI
jgi:hypothetical protein